MPLVSMTGITKSFNGVHALRDVFLDVERGEVHALVGENGAGKSTLMKILAGVSQADAGAIVFNGRAIRPQNYRESVKAGISMIFQETSLFENLTVAENLLFDRLPRHWWGTLSFRRLFAAAEAALQELEFHIAADARVGELAVGERQMIEIAKALVTGAKLVIMDEPTACLNSRESERLFSLIEKLKHTGVSVIYISHRLDEVLRISGRLSVLRDGKMIATHCTRDTNQKQVIHQMVGRGVELFVSHRESGDSNQAVVLELDRLAMPGKLCEVSFSIRAGEILGVAGLRGVGQEHLVRALLGLESAYTGSIRIAGVPRRIKSPAQAIACGIAYVTDDRKGKGLLLDRNSAYNGTLGSIEAISRKGFLQKRLEQRVARRQAIEFAMATDRPAMPVKYLSGGNQQKVMLARALEQKPAILILNEPTAGIDVGAKEEIYNLLGRYASMGMAIVLISSDIAELTTLSHRVLVINQKRPAVLIPAQSASDASIIEAAVT
jgi:ribose transport system ATP-binding protein